MPAKATAEVMGEGRAVAIDGGRFEDAFEGDGVPLCRIGEKKP